LWGYLGSGLPNIPVSNACEYELITASIGKIANSTHWRLVATSALMTTSPTPEQIAKMDADQLRALLLGQIKANSKLQAKVVEVQSTNAELQVVREKQGP